jgi:myo-inositol-1(or 4)-monophosphatase
MDLETVSRVAVKAAYRSADILRSRLGHLSTVAKKGPTDLVTDADLASEAEIMRTIREAFPDHAIVAEESGAHAGPSSDHRWIVDPLDGTVNYAHQVPIFAVSIAYAFRDAIRVGVVLNPLDGELFSAVEGGGARLNGRPIRVSTAESELSESLLATGFPYDLEADFDALGARFLRCLRRARGIRRLGSAALDLCYVACGRFAGYWDHVQPWDAAAGTLLVREAGGTVTDFHNRPLGAEAREVLATNGGIHAELLSLMEEERR